MYVCNTHTVLSVKNYSAVVLRGTLQAFVGRSRGPPPSSHDAGFTQEPFSMDISLVSRITGFISACSSTVVQHVFFGHCAWLD